MFKLRDTLAYFNTNSHEKILDRLGIEPVILVMVLLNIHTFTA